MCDPWPLTHPGCLPVGLTPCATPYLDSEGLLYSQDLWNVTSPGSQKHGSWFPKALYQGEGLDHDQYSCKGDLIGLWSEQNRFLKLVDVVQLNANVTDQGNPNEGMRNRKWKSVVIATTITGAQPLLGLEPYGALGFADLQSLDIKEYSKKYAT